MYMTENKTQLTLSCIANMIRYGHEDILEELLEEHNEKVVVHYYRIKTLLSSEKFKKENT